MRPELRPMLPLRLPRLPPQELPLQRVKAAIHASARPYPRVAVVFIIVRVRRCRGSAHRSVCLLASCVSSSLLPQTCLLTKWPPTQIHPSFVFSPSYLLDSARSSPPCICSALHCIFFPRRRLSSCARPIRPSVHPSILLRYLTIPPNPSIISLISYLFLAVLILVVVFLSSVPLPPPFCSLASESNHLLFFVPTTVLASFLIPLAVSCTIITHRPPRPKCYTVLVCALPSHIIYIPSLYILAFAPLSRCRPAVIQKPS